jgi:hypothetical protein
MSGAYSRIDNHFEMGLSRFKLPVSLGDSGLDGSRR